MKLSAPLSTLALQAPAALGAALPACSTKSVTPCRCPSGTEYAESMALAIIGAAATDVRALMADFFNTGWLFGIIPFETSGPNNKPGTTRTSVVPTLIGDYFLPSETALIAYQVPYKQLTKLQTDKDGSFIQRFEQLDSSIPVNYASGNGSWSGYWVMIEANAVLQYETVIMWSIYACETGHPRNFSLYFDTALRNATSILENEGKVRGTNMEPFLIQSF